jgi:MSHA biogenesis protein MshQ
MNRDESWWNTDWSYRKTIHIDHTKVHGDLENIPTLIQIDNDSSLSTHAQPDFDDIVFTDNTGNQLAHEIESFNNTNGDLLCWVNITELSSTENTILYLYYGNSSATNQENPEGVWDTDYLAVHHLAETTGTHYDSTSNDYDGTASTGVDQDAEGMLDGADAFNNTNEHVTLPQVFTSESSFSIACWIYPESGARYAISQWSSNNGVFIQVSSAGTGVEWYIDGTSAGSTTISLGAWYHIVVTYDGSTARLYKNGGTPTTKSMGSPTWPFENTYIADRSNF